MSQIRREWVLIMLLLMSLILPAASAFWLESLLRHERLDRQPLEEIPLQIREPEIAQFFHFCPRPKIGELQVYLDCLDQYQAMNSRDF